MKLKREMNNTSSQDEFAKWAKLRRRHDKAMEEYEAMSAYLQLPTTYKTRSSTNIFHRQDCLLPENLL